MPGTVTLQIGEPFSESLKDVEVELLASTLNLYFILSEAFRSMKPGIIAVSFTELTG